MTDIIQAIHGAGGELSLSSTGGLVGLRVPPEMVPAVREQKPAIIAILRRHADLEAAGVDADGIRAVDDLAATFDAEVVSVGPAPEPEPIRPKRVPTRRMDPGDDVQLAEGGPWYRVERVTPTAAYLKPLYREPVQVELPNGRKFKAKGGGHMITVAPTAFPVARRKGSAS